MKAAPSANGWSVPWPVVRLKYRAEIQSGLTLGKDYGNRELVERPYLRVANVQSGFLDLSEITTVWVPPGDAPAYELRAGDVLMTEGGDADKLGRGYVWEGQIDGCLHQNHVFAVRPDKGRLEPHYLALVMTSEYGRDYFTRTAHQTTNLASTNSTKLGDLPVPLPPLAMQASLVSSVAGRTEHLDELIGAKNRMLDLLREKRQALVTRLVTRGLDAAARLKDSGLPWLGPVPDHWAVERLKFSLSLLEQGWSPQCDSRPADDNEWGVLKVGCVNGDEFDPAEQKALPAEVEPETRYEVRPGDILMSRGNTLELVGSAAIVREVRPRLLLCDLLYRLRLRPEKADPEFVTLQMRSPFVRRQIERDATGTSSSMKKIGQETIGDFVVCLPPLPEQEVIVERVRRETIPIDAAHTRIEQQLAKLREYRQALITAAVTGRLDVMRKTAV